ncbi:hypothetical protein CAPTEDRAFT_163933 [Capitella teleta]|uniref:UPAR/Ly6 domain-containing protein n=1 Tax=Capitella teleta TaxID=283909 RepID=R7TGI9_CAPTE|nr:hypothetical protein CAPTEDRAFT_163933 [Capitella teleta]|eukprot:ELT92794.1 hypothetical protein CAPTEDRAFT_163933 [Capitella teleta]
MDKLCLYSALFFVSVSSVLSLECYSCEEEERNRGTCNSRTSRCEDFQDACTSYVRWGIPPQWSPRGDRRYYISKGCDTMQGCIKRQEATFTTCNRDWYNDWACVECCSGDLCNYFVTKGAGNVRASMATVGVISSLLLVFKKIWL